MIYDTAIIGGGPVGIFSIFMLGTLGLKACIIDILPILGGQCKGLYPDKYIYDIPAYPKILAGDLIDKLEEQSSIFEPSYYLNNKVIDIKKNTDNIFTITTDKTIIQCKTIIIASGGGMFVPNMPEINNINKYSDNTLFFVKDIEKLRNKDIVIAGGGDSALDWCIQLQGISKKIALVHRRDVFRGIESSIKHISTLEKDGAITIYLNSTILDFFGENGLSGIKVEQKDNIIEIPCDYILFMYGMKTDNTYNNKWGLECNKDGILVNHTDMCTNIDGIYGVGDAVTYNGKRKLILSGFAECATAAYGIYHFIYPEKKIRHTHSTSDPIYQKR